MQISSSFIARTAAIVGAFMLVIATALGMVLPAGAAAATVYYMSNLDGTVKTYQSGGSVTTIANVAGGSNFGATSVAVDSLHGYVYWSGQRQTTIGTPGSGNTGYVRRASAATGASAIEQWTTTDTAMNNNVVSAVTINPTTQVAYWSGEDNSTGFLKTGDASGSTITASASRSPASLTSLALETSNALLYWAASYSSPSSTFQSVTASAIASGATTFANTNADLIDSLATSPSGTTVYWSRCVLAANLGSGCAGTGTIMQKATSTSAGASTTLFGSLTNNTSVAVDADGCVLYTTLAGTVVRPASGACTAATLVTGGGSITSLWIVDAPSTTAPPTISGTTTPGSTLTCNDATWAGDLPGSHLSRQPTSARTYQWHLNGTPIGGAAASTYATPGGTYGVYGCTVTASNVAGSGTSSLATTTFATVPGAPTGVSAAASGTSTADVAWTAPSSDGYSAITSYTATATPGGASCTSTSTSCTVTGLSASTAYTFTVAATNAVGTGASSAASGTATTRALATAPGAPTGASATRSGSGKLTVSWTTPASNGGSAITGYTATATPGGKTCTSTGTSCSISGLANGTSYTVTVTAANAVGTGSASSASKAAYPYASITVTWKLSGRALTATFRPVTGAKSYALSSTGATRKSGTCKTTGSGTKRRVSCTLTLKKGTSTLTVKAKNTAKQVIAQATKSKSARRLSVIAHR